MNDNVPSPSATLLLVDDEANILGALRRRFQPLGYRVLTAGSGAEGLAILEREPVDLVISDMRMPGMDGAAFLEQVALRRPGVIRFLLTGYADLASAVAAINQGRVAGYFSKPWDDTEIRLAVQDALERKARDEARDRRLAQLESEHEVVAQVVANTLRPSRPEEPNVRFFLAPTEASNGDLLLTARRAPAIQQLLLGDFTGHGLSAAVGALPAADVFNAQTARGAPLATLIGEVNRLLKRVLPVGIFFAACFVEADWQRRRLTVWNGGLPDVLVLGHAGIETRLPSRHLPLGILDQPVGDDDFTLLELRPDQRVYLCTDGVLEAVNVDGEMFGLERLEQALTAGAPEGAFARVEAALAAFRAGAVQRDDMTLVELRGDSRVCRTAAT